MISELGNAETDALITTANHVCVQFSSISATHQSHLIHLTITYLATENEGKERQNKPLFVAGTTA